MEVFMRTNAVDEAFEDWRASTDPALRKRTLDNGALFFPIEMPAFATFIPNCAVMRTGGVPLTIVVGEENRDTRFGATGLVDGPSRAPPGRASRWERWV